MASPLQFSLAAGLALLLPLSAAANTATCADRTLIVNALMERFGEERSGQVRSDSDEILEVFSNETSQTWTILLTLPDRGLTCHVASGTGRTALDTRLASARN